ncbi:MAG: DUF805 domain-containing protein [Flavobacteriaceae bacterium]|nr:DUF805 domain-containing protein [Flavobacteriaceae bacterium]
MVDWWKKVFIENYANFEGRARRSEYWYYILANILIVVSFYISVLYAFEINIDKGQVFLHLLFKWLGYIVVK